MNRDIWKIKLAAEERVRQRLLGRPVLEVGTIMSGCGVSKEREAAAFRLLDGLGSVLGVKVGLLRPEDSLGELLRVKKEELGPNLSEKAWAAAGLGDFIEAFCYDIMHLVEQLATRSGWKEKWQELEPRPRNEEQWIDRIMAMTVREFVQFFSETMK